MIPLLRHLLSAAPRSHRLALAALACWLGVLTAKLVEAQMMRLNIHRSIEGTLEEGLEIAGPSLSLIAFCEVPASVDTLKPAIERQGKTGHHRRATETMWFYCATASGRKSAATFVRQLRGPHFSTCA